MFSFIRIAWSRCLFTAIETLTNTSIKNIHTDQGNRTKTSGSSPHTLTRISKAYTVEKTALPTNGAGKTIFL